MIFALRDVTADRVNLIMNDFASGLPSPLAFLGLGDAVARDLGVEPWTTRVLPILHSVEEYAGRTRPEFVNKNGKFCPVEAPEDMLGTVQFSVVFDIPGVTNAEAVKDALEHKRLAGGLPRIREERPDVITGAADNRILARLPRGMAMIPVRSTEFRRITSGEPCGLEAVADLLYPEEAVPGRGWFFPAAVGYRLLEDPDVVNSRENTRDETVPHVFAEPVLGIGELMSVRNSALHDLAVNEFDQVMWSWEARGEWVLGHKSYHPEHNEQEPSHAKEKEAA